MIKTILFSIFLLTSSAIYKVSAQCNNPALVNNQNINEITSPWQLNFLHLPVQNRLDSLVVELISNKPVDSLNAVRLVEAIGATRSAEAYCLLYTCCCRPLAIGDLNVFNRLAGTISYYGGYRVLNNFFLDNAVINSNNNQQFATEVVQQCTKKEPACYYCKPPNELDAYVKELEKINTKKYDRKIKRIIKRNSDLNKVGGLASSQFAMDSIVQQISRLPFVSDVFWDKCAVKIAIYPGWNIIGVILMIDNKPVEKTYTVQVGKLVYFKLFKKRLFQLSNNNNALVYKGSRVSPGFIYKERENCMQQ